MSALTRPRAGRFRGEAGNAMIEMCLIVPILLLLLLGVVDFGIILHQDIRVADSARAGAEYGLIRAHTKDLTGIQNVAKSAAQNIPGYSVTATNYCTCSANGAAAGCSSYTMCGAYGLPNLYVQVTATAQLPLLFGLQGIPANLSVQSVAIVRGTWPGQ